MHYTICQSRPKLIINISIDSNHIGGYLNTVADKWRMAFTGLPQNVFETQGDIQIVILSRQN